MLKTIHVWTAPLLLLLSIIWLFWWLIMHILMKNNSSYGIKDCIYIYFPTIRYQIPYAIISPWVTSEHHYNLLQLSLLLESFVIAFRLNAPFLIKCYYRQLSVFSITENIILIEITRIIGTGLLNGPMKAWYESRNTCNSGNVPHFQFLADDEDDDESRSFVKLFPLRGNI